ncbi:hypothetical protein B0H14DRAFT_2718756 [Mycena olivaceomarginata]|nr:hypothetical protein B0H14DRAFT_2718756 [Mycena olivaceomarginata]
MPLPLLVPPSFCLSAMMSSIRLYTPPLFFSAYPSAGHCHQRLIAVPDWGLITPMLILFLYTAPVTAPCRQVWFFFFVLFLFFFPFQWVLGASLVTGGSSDGHLLSVRAAPRSLSVLEWLMPVVVAC